MFGIDFRAFYRKCGLFGRHIHDGILLLRPCPYVRFLHDDLPQGLCVVLIAVTRGERSLRAQRMLATRTAGWPHIWPLTRDQVPQAIPVLHPLWQSVAPGDLKALDARLADGCLRRWVVLTLHTQRALAATGASKPDGGMLQAVADRIDGGRRP